MTPYFVSFLHVSYSFLSTTVCMGVEFTRREFESKFPGEKLNSIEAYLKFVTKNGYSAHATTLECAVHGFSSIKDLMSLRKAAKAKNPETVQNQ